MPVSVADRSANKNEVIDHAAELLQRSTHRRAVFSAVYRGKSKIKWVPDLMVSTKLPHTRVLDAGRELDANDLVHAVRVDGVTGYEKISFFQEHRDRILRLARNPRERAKLPTKRRPAAAAGSTVRVKLDVRLPVQRARAKLVTIDDIDSFRRVKGVDPLPQYFRIAETRFKTGVARILGERSAPKDWGGELRDLMSTRLTIKGKRLPAAFAFKGPGKSGILTPAKMGKNGDQIQRLLRCPAQVFIVQYWRDIDDAVLEQLERFAYLKAFLEGVELRYGLIDGDDSTRLLRAYSEQFGLSNTDLEA
jgi:hypothetical protein